MVDNNLKMVAIIIIIIILIQLSLSLRISVSTGTSLVLPLRVCLSMVAVIFPLYVLTKRDYTNLTSSQFTLLSQPYDVAVGDTC